MEAITGKFESLYGCLAVFEYFCLQYFSLKTSLRGNFKDKISLSRKIYFGFLILITMLLGVLSIISVSSSKKVTTKNVLTLIYAQSANYFFFFAIWSSLVQSFRSTSHIKKLFMNSKQIIESCSSEFDAFMCFETIPKSMLKRYAVESIVFITVYSATAYQKYSTGKLDVLWLVMSMIHTIFFIVVVNKFLFYVGLINFQLKFIESLLSNADTFKVTPSNKKIYFLSDSDLPLNFFVNSKCQEIWKVYNKILENGSLINKSCGCTILMILVDIIEAVTYSGYVLCATAMGDSSEDIIGKIHVAKIKIKKLISLN